MPGAVPDPTPIIHMTHVTNLPKIIQNRGLLATSILAAKSRTFTNIAYSSIQGQRAAKQVPCGPKGLLHDYVPFYFTRKSPMLYTINRGNVPCDGGQDAIVHLVSTAQRVAKAGLRFVFTDGHGIMGYTGFYDKLSQLPEVDWDIIANDYWADTLEDGDRKRRKQAEFLVHKQFAWEHVGAIVVRSQTRSQEVANMLAGLAHRPQVVVKPNWYY